MKRLAPVLFGLPVALCLDITAGNAANGARVQIYECNGTPAQQWSAR